MKEGYIMGIRRNNKFNSFFIGIMMMTVLWCWNSQAQPAQNGEFIYISISGESQITKYTGAGGVVTIPSSVPGGPVTSIGDNAFRDCIGLTSISIPKDVTSIGWGAFAGTGLTSITIPQGVTSIEDMVFSDCKGLSNIIIPPGVTKIGMLAFNGCTGLTSITIPQGVTSIDYMAFSNCTGLTSITFNSANTSIDDNTGTIPATAKIIGYDPSTAKAYATNYGRTFEVISNKAIVIVVVGLIALGIVAFIWRKRSSTPK